MTQQDAETQRKRLVEYNRLTALHKDYREVLEKIESADPDGPCGQGPFTGNTRESRDVLSLDIFFSTTKGGSPSTRMRVEGLKLDAFKLRELLTADLREKIKALESAIEAL